MGSKCNIMLPTALTGGASGANPTMELVPVGNTVRFNAPNVKVSLAFGALDLILTRKHKVDTAPAPFREKFGD
jgi:hypothetical protein